MELETPSPELWDAREERRGFVVAGVPFPSRPMCVTDRKPSRVRLLKTPPGHPCESRLPSPTSRCRGGMDGVTLPVHQGYVPLTGLPYPGPSAINACWVGKVRQGPWELSPGGSDRNLGWGKLLPSSSPPASYSDAQERDASASGEVSPKARHLALPATRTMR